MSAPFVISMKIVGDGSNAVASTDAVVQGLDHVGDAMDAQRVRALELVQAEREIIRLGREMVNIPAVSKVQTGINQATGVGQPGRSTSAAQADIEAYGRQLDDLRAKYNPLFAAERAHEEVIRDIQRAYKVGAISSDEMAAAILRESKAHELLTQRIQQETGAKQLSNSAGLQSFNTANAAAQFQDIAVTAAMGMNPLQIGLQQGTQLAMVLQSSLGEKGAAGAAKLLLTSLVSLVSPISLVAIGLTVVGAAAFQWLGGMLPKMETASERLERHQDELAKITRGYADAEAAVSAFAESSATLPRGAVQIELGVQLKQMSKEAEGFSAKAASLGPVLSASLNGNEKALGDMLVAFRDGKTSASDLVVQLTQLGAADLGPLGFVLKGVVTDLAEGAKAAAAFQDAYIAIEHATAATGWNGGVATALQSMVEGTKSATSHQIEMDAINAKGPAQLADIARRRTALELQDEQISETLRQQKIDEAGSLAYAQASRGLVDGERNRLLAVRDSIAAAQLDLEVIGKSAEETERLRFVRQNLASAEQAAAQAGTTVSATYRAEIEKLGEAYGALRSQVQIYSMAQDLAFERAQLGRSDIEKKVASQLRPIFGDDLTGSQSEFLAQQIRINETLSQTNDIGREFTSGFLSDLTTELRSGSGLFEAFGNAGASALDKLADKLIGMAADGLWDMLFGALTSSLTGGYKPATGYVAGIGAYGQYETGGWTGGSRGQVAGVVHGEEFVVKAGPAAANRAVLEAMNSGGSIGGGSSVAFSPVNQFSVTGGEADIATYERLLDERDRRLTSQFQTLVEAHLENPMRKWA